MYVPPPWHPPPPGGETPAYGGAGREEHPHQQRGEGGHPHPNTDDSEGAPTWSGGEPFLCRGLPPSGEEGPLVERQHYGAENNPRREYHRPCDTKTMFFWRVNTPSDVLLEWATSFWREPPSQIEKPICPGGRGKHPPTHTHGQGVGQKPCTSTPTQEGEREEALSPSPPVITIAWGDGVDSSPGTLIHHRLNSYCTVFNLISRSPPGPGTFIIRSSL